LAKELPNAVSFPVVTWRVLRPAVSINYAYQSWLVRNLRAAERSRV
jgi:hypothetical protein